MGLYFSISALVILTIIAFNFFLKERVKNIETITYQYIILLTMIGLSLDIFSGLLYNYGYDPNSFIYVLISKFVFLYFIIWTMLFTFYIQSISFPHQSEYKIINSRVFLKLCSLFVLVMPFVLLFDVNFSVMNSVIVPEGVPVMVTYSVAGLLIVSSIIIAIKNRKNIKLKKIYPLYVFCVLMIISFLIQRFYPDAFLINYLLSVVVIVMYFSIENPDVKMLEQVEMAKERADRANKAKTDFLSAMSHEIRTPLNAIVGFSESLKEEELSESQLEEVNDIIDASQTLLETVNGVLDISKIESGKIEIVDTTYSFEKVFKELVALSKARLGDDKPIEFRYHLAEDVPKFLYGDFVRVKQVILNFLTNAIKYTKEGYIDFDVRCINNGGICRLIVKVEDSGIGIKKESINRLFDKFDRLDNENSTIEGTGLGLAITKKLVELMHGKIIVQSVYGKGSQFTIVLDQRIVNEKVAEEVVEIKEENSTISHDLSNKKILIVDDNLMNLKVAARLIKPYNIQVEQADSGFKCLDLIGSGNSYDLILMDDMMPKMNGKETFKKLKDDSSFNTPVVILTANAITGMKEEYLGLGFNDYLAKPIEKDELNRVIKKFLDN